jgi:hypothetical protein
MARSKSVLAAVAGGSATGAGLEPGETAESSATGREAGRGDAGVSGTAGGEVSVNVCLPGGFAAGGVFCRVTTNATLLNTTTNTKTNINRFMGIPFGKRY